MIEKIAIAVLRCVPNDGEHIMGFADLRGLLHERFAGFGYGICVGRTLDDSIIYKIIHGPNADYLALYKETNRRLADLVDALSSEMDKAGVRNLPVKPTSSLVDHSDEYITTLRHTFSHKMVGTRAGLGWIGKSDLFIS